MMMMRLWWDDDDDKDLNDGDFDNENDMGCDVDPTCSAKLALNLIKLMIGMVGILIKVIIMMKIFWR